MICSDWRKLVVGCVVAAFTRVRSVITSRAGESSVTGTLLDGSACAMVVLRSRGNVRKAGYRLMQSSRSIGSIRRRDGHYSQPNTGATGERGVAPAGNPTPGDRPAALMSKATTPPGPG